MRPRGTGRRAPGRRVPLALFLLVAAVVLVVESTVGYLPRATSGGGTAVPPGSPLGWGAGGAVALCNAPSTSPSAVRVSAPNPLQSIATGGALAVTYQVAAMNASRGALPVQLYIPSVTAVFPLSPSGSASVFLAPRTLTLNSTGWGGAASVTQTRSVSTGIAFDSSHPSFATTQKIALMATDAYGRLTVGVRWHWSEVVRSGAKPANGSWTTPSPTAASPDLPSDFYPAPYVTVVRTSATTMSPGTTFTVTLGGAVANTSFRVVVEYPNNGTEITSRWQTTPLGATQFNATAPMTYSGGTSLPAGKYLVHLHDHCQAIVHSLPVTVT